MADRYELRYGAKSEMLVGIARKQVHGWKFFPRVSGRIPSRKFHETALDSVPGWARKYLPEHGGEWRAA